MGRTGLQRTRRSSVRVGHALRRCLVHCCAGGRSVVAEGAAGMVASTARAATRQLGVRDSVATAFVFLRGIDALVSGWSCAVVAVCGWPSLTVVTWHRSFTP